MHPRVLNRGVDSFNQWGVELGKVLAQRTSRNFKAKQNQDLTRNSTKNFSRRHQNKEELQ